MFDYINKRLQCFNDLKLVNTVTYETFISKLKACMAYFILEFSQNYIYLLLTNIINMLKPKFPPVPKLSFRI